MAEATDFTPTRLVFVRRHRLGSEVQLHSGPQPTRRVDYVTLSQCWGGDGAQRSLMMTSENQESVPSSFTGSTLSHA